jgi:hypothetical protein
MSEIPNEMMKKELFAAQNILPTIREFAALHTSSLALLRLNITNTGAPGLQTLE